MAVTNFCHRIQTLAIIGIALISYYFDTEVKKTETELKLYYTMVT